MANKKNEKQDVEIAMLQQWKTDFSEFTTNHLSKLEKKVDRILNWLFVGFILMIGASIITQIILKLFL
mgnify:CR=1 FL=1|tara:strand:+ start:601 stop:804 length:204 start_codon:yes stop_codon:yes gene_type:complete